MEVMWALLDLEYARNVFSLAAGAMTTLHSQ